MKLPLGFTINGPTTFASGTTLDVAVKTWLGALYTQMSWTGGGVGVYGGKLTLCNLFGGFY